MPNKSTTDLIKKLNPKNISGTIPQALDLIRSLRDSKGNPKMVDAVGLMNLIGMLKHVQNTFSQAPKKNTDILQLLINILKKMKINNIDQDTIVAVGLELLGYQPFSVSEEISYNNVVFIADAIKSNAEIKQLIYDAEEIVNNSLEYIKKIIDIKNNV